MQATSRYARYMFLGIGLVLLSLPPALAACSVSNGMGSSGGTPTVQRTTGKSVTDAATSSVTSEVLLGVQPCLALLKIPPIGIPLFFRRVAVTGWKV